MIAEDRASCVVMGCRRTFKRDDDDPGDIEYMCGAHYRLADARLRRRRTWLKRRGRRWGWSWQAERIDKRLWALIVAQATERSFGI